MAMTDAQYDALRTLELAFANASDALDSKGWSVLDHLQAHVKSPDSINDVIDAVDHAMKL